MFTDLSTENFLNLATPTPTIFFFFFFFLPTPKVGGAVYTPVFTVVYEWKCLVKYLSNLSFHLSFVHFANTCFTLFIFSILFCLLVQRTEMHEQTACIPKAYCMQKYAPDWTIWGPKLKKVLTVGGGPKKNCVLLKCQWQCMWWHAACCWVR